MTHTSILIIQLKRLGDVLMTTPTLRALKKNVPNCHLTFLTQAPSDQLLSENPYIDHIITLPSNMSFWNWIQLFLKINRMKLDLVFDFSSMPITAIITYSSFAKKRIGGFKKNRNFLYTTLISLPPDIAHNTYSAAHKLTFLKAIGIKDTSLDLDFPISTKDKHYADTFFKTHGIKENDFVVTLSPVSRKTYKSWPTNFFATLTDYLVTTYQAKVIILYGPDEQRTVEALTEKMSQQAITHHPTPRIAQTMALIEKSSLHVGNDNGPRHFAIAAKTPSLAIFGAINPKNWTPPNHPLHRVISHEIHCKSHCLRHKCPDRQCLSNITPAQVIDVLNQHIQDLKRCKKLTHLIKSPKNKENEVS